MYEMQRVGKQGEEIAEKYLKKQGYKILNKNFRCKQGEIDLIASDKNEIVIIEVKTRTSNTYGNPADAVDIRKQRHIYNAAQYYLYKNKLETKQIRIDVIEIYIEGKKIKINHIKKAIFEI